MNTMNVLLASTIKVSLIVLVALTAVAALRKRSASLRHWLLAAALACAAGAPLREAVVPAWDLRTHVASGSYVASGFSRTPGGSNPAKAGSHVLMTHVLMTIWITGMAVSLSLPLVGLARLAWLASGSERITRGPWRDLADAISRKYANGGGTIRESRNASTQPEFDPCSQSTVGGCISPPRKIRDVKPRYPQQLWEAGKGGTVRLEGRIGTDGFLKDLRVMAPADPDLANAAVEAAGQWQFSQTRLDGAPIEVRLTISATFKPQQ